MLDLLAAAADRAHDLAVILAVPNPGAGTAPPGSEKLITLLRWVAWIVSGLCVAGVMIVAGRMALQHQRGEGGQHGAGLAWVMAACILLGSASGIVGALI
jgi:hypothetical protein